MWLIFIHSSQDVLIEAIITKIEGTIRYFILVPYNAVWYFPEGTNLPLLGFWVFWKSMWKKAFTNLSQVQSYILFVFCFGRGLFCFCFYWALDNGLWSISASYAPLGRCPLWFSWDSSQSFCFFLELLLLFAGGSLFRSPAVWLLLGRQFLPFWGDPLVSWLFRVLTGSPLGKDFFLLGRLPVSTHSLRLHLNTFLQDISETL